MIKAVFPGSFDPITFGHLDIVKKASHIFDELEVTVAVNAGKNALLSLEDRTTLIAASTEDLKNVTVSNFSGLIADKARECGARVIVRGIRQSGDYEYEARMAYANKKLYPEIESVFLLPSQEYSLVSSTLVREIFFHQGNITPFVPKPVEEFLRTYRPKK